METKIVTIDLGSRSYDIFIGENMFAHIDDYLPQSVQGKKIFIVTDENAKSYADIIHRALKGLDVGFCEIFVLPSGEKTKSYSFLQDLHGWMLKNNIHRNSLIMAVGGGVVGDLTGFAAATVMRGVPFIQIPTTLLSQVDSSVGGKTGINTAQGKNLVGSFYQPVAVLADVDTLKSLPQRELLAGYAEVVKYGLLGDYDFFEWLEEFGEDVMAIKDFAISAAIEVSCKTKAEIVQADEREGGRRALLNLGHTFGHALEAAAGYDGTLLHGEAVSIGMVMAFDLSVRMGICTKADLERVKAHLRSVGLPICASQIKPRLISTVDDLIATMRRDKKAQDDRMTFILVRGIGSAFVTQDVPEKLVREVLQNSMTEVIE